MRTIVEALVRDGHAGHQVLDRAPGQRALGDQEEQRAEDGGGKDQHLDEPEEAELAKNDGEGVHEDDFDVEDHEDHRDEVEADGKALGRLDLGDDPALVRRQLRVRWTLVRGQQRRGYKRSRREQHSEDEESKY